MLERLFALGQNHTSLRIEVMAGITTFLTMAYIIFVQPAALSGAMFGLDTGMDFQAVAAATCISAGLASILMGLYARYPVALAPGMGMNFFFVLTMIPAAEVAISRHAWQTAPWQLALGVVFVSGFLFVLLSLLGIREALMDSISPSIKHAIAVGIGLFIAFIGLQNARLVIANPGTLVRLNRDFLSPDLIVFFVGLLVAAILQVRRVRGFILWGVLAATLLAVALKLLLPLVPALGDSVTVQTSMLVNRFTLATHIVSLPNPAPTFLQMDVWHALSLSMVPFIIVFLFMDIFDTMGTLIGVASEAHMLRDNKLPRVKQAFLTDAAATVAGAALGTSTVTSYIESVTGVEAGGRTGLTAVVTGLLMLAALFFTPLIAMVGSYPPVTAPALVIVGAMMTRSVMHIDWNDYSEAIPAFLIILGIPLSYSIGDGMALGFIAYPLIKLLSGRAKDIGWLTYGLGAILLTYFLVVRRGIDAAAFGG